MPATYPAQPSPPSPVPAKPRPKLTVPLAQLAGLPIQADRQPRCFHVVLLHTTEEQNHHLASRKTLIESLIRELGITRFKPGDHVMRSRDPTMGRPVQRRRADQGGDPSRKITDIRAGRS